MKTILFIFLAILGSCSSNYERDKNDPNYQNGLYHPPSTPYAGNGGDAAVAGLVSGIALAVNRDYYRDKAITGKCLCRESVDSPIELECNGIAVGITDAKGKELGKVDTINGEFAFRVQPKTTYGLQIDSLKYQVVSPAPKSLSLGDDVIFHLVRVKGKTPAAGGGS